MALSVHWAIKKSEFHNDPRIDSSKLLDQSRPCFAKRDSTFDFGWFLGANRKGSRVVDH
jgi:hypothetical protein